MHPRAIAQAGGETWLSGWAEEVGEEVGRVGSCYTQIIRAGCLLFGEDGWVRTCVCKLMEPLFLELMTCVVTDEHGRRGTACVDRDDSEPK